MAHQLYSERFLGRRDPAWHKLGTVIAAGRKITVSEAMAELDMFYQFEKWPLHATGPNGQIIDIDRVAIMRGPNTTDDTWRFINTAEADFGVIQNEALARQLDPLSERWPLETVGALQQGATTFVTLATGSYDIAKDQLNRYLLVSDGKSGDHALRIATVDIRVVCANTLDAAWNGRDNGLRISFSHHKGVANDLKLYTELFEGVATAQERQRIAFEQMAATKISREQAKDVLHTTFPRPTVARKLAMFRALLDEQGLVPVQAQEEYARLTEWHEQLDERAQRTRIGALDCYDRLCDSNLLIAGTAWAAYNASVEVIDCLAGNAVRAAESTLFGDRARKRGVAFRAAWDLVEAN